MGEHPSSIVMRQFCPSDNALCILHISPKMNIITKVYDLFLGVLDQCPSWSLMVKRRMYNVECRQLDMALKTCTAFEMPSSSDVHHCFMIGLRDNRWRGLVQEECEMEDIGDCHLAGHWVQHLR